MEASGQITKMHTSLVDVVQYSLMLDGKQHLLNGLIGQPIRFEFLQEIRCVECGRKTKKSFGEGFCYPCFMESPGNAPCIVRPELCEGHLGAGRCSGGSNSHAEEHFVYLALSSEVKVGVTRSTQVPTRWIDQGASSAIKLAATPYRRLAGEMEVFLKSHFTDKTSWQKMLKNEVGTADLRNEKQRVASLLPDALRSYIVQDNEVTHINYPVQCYPDKITSVGFEKFSIIEGRLTGIKGQYLLFDDNRVLNLRAHSGYVVRVQG